MLDKGSASLNFPDFRDIPRIPDSTHAQLESSKFQLWGRKIFSLFYVSINRMKNVLCSQYRSCLFVCICLNMSSYCIIYLPLFNNKLSQLRILWFRFDIGYKLRWVLIEESIILTKNKNINSNFEFLVLLLCIWVASYKLKMGKKCFLFTAWVIATLNSEYAYFIRATQCYLNWLNPYFM